MSSAAGPHTQANANQLLGGLLIIAVLLFVGLQVLGYGVIDTTLVITMLSAALALLGAKEAGMYFLRGGGRGRPDYYEYGRHPEYPTSPYDRGDDEVEKR